MPGAQLDDVVDEHRWKATMHVKLGPIALRFDTDVVRREADQAGRRVVLSADGRELRGRGRAQATIESSLVETENGTDAAIVTDLALQGTAAQYGRGMIADVSSQLTDQFAACLAQKLAVEPEVGLSPPQEDTAGATAVPSAAGESAVKPIGGVRLVLRAILRRVRRLLGRRPGKA
jgi:carbon monoxide dehydrogenase subunit G